MKMNRNKSAFIASLNLPSTSHALVSDIWIRYETELHASLEANGKIFTLNRYKACYEFLRNKTLELTTLPIPFCKSDSSGIPKPLWSLRPLIKGSLKYKRIALCIARAYEQIILGIDLSKLSNITDEISDENLKSALDIDKIFKIFLRKFGNKYQ